ncbi:MAG: hypothetical protein VX475_23815, partial [Myxococcota bacterium]|nr:hypothetical protein [Myxococcota bacterium]
HQLSYPAKGFCEEADLVTGGGHYIKSTSMTTLVMIFLFRAGKFLDMSVETHGLAEIRSSRGRWG